jgi:hypothetical protein
MIIELKRPVPLHFFSRFQLLLGARSVATARLPIAVPIIAALASIAAIAWSASTGSLTLYSDSLARMAVARHVTDGITPGLGQLGSVWLPLAPILMIPFAAVDALWHSGAAGAIVSGFAFFYSAIRVFSLADEWLESRTAAWVAFAIYVTNLNLLYVQTAALTEPVLLAVFVGAVYHFARWMRTRSTLELAWAALLTMLATLTRYDGWALLLAATAVVWWWSRSHERRAKATQANVLLFITVGAYGVLLWLLYNLIIFHNAFEFITSTFSSQSQQRSLAQVGELLTNFNLGHTILTFGWDVIDVIGAPVVVAGLIGAALLARSRGRNRGILILLATPIVFNVVMLFLGQSAMRVPQTAPFQMFNNRYGLMALPFFALAAAGLVQRWRIVTPVVLAAAAASVAIFAVSTPITLADGQSGVSSSVHGRPPVMATYLSTHYHGGGILADDYSANPLMFASGLDLRQFVTICCHPYYENALADPATSVQWVLVHQGDAIAQDMAMHAERFTAFTPVETDGYFTLYERTGSP